jgi:hypothetical protein
MTTRWRRVDTWIPLAFQLVLEWRLGARTCFDLPRRRYRENLWESPCVCRFLPPTKVHNTIPFKKYSWSGPGPTCFLHTYTGFPHHRLKILLVEHTGQDRTRWHPAMINKEGSWDADRFLKFRGWQTDSDVVE